MEQHWVGSTELWGMLASIGGWHVGCLNHREAFEAVNYALDRKFVTLRIHYAEGIPEGQVAFELTDFGIQRLWEIRGEQAKNDARKMRQWYRDNTSKPLVKIDA